MNWLQLKIYVSETSLCVDIHNIVCIVCVCKLCVCMCVFLIVRNIYIKYWYWCLVYELTFNNLVVIYSMCKYTVWYVYLLLHVVTTDYMWNKFCTCFMIFSTFFGIVQWKICKIYINSIMFIFWDVIVWTLVDIYWCSVLSLSVSVESAGSSEISVNFYQITWHVLVDDITWIACMVFMSEVL
jgi:hypothetical protein